VQPGCPGSSSPSTSPARTTAPGRTVGRTGSYVVRRPSSWSTETTPRAPIGPANTTVPARAVSTDWPAAPTRSTPRWPRPYGCGGARKRAAIAGAGSRGHAYRAPGAGTPPPGGGAGAKGGRSGGAGAAPGGACRSGGAGRPSEGGSERTGGRSGGIGRSSGGGAGALAPARPGGAGVAKPAGRSRRDVSAAGAPGAAAGSGSIAAARAATSTRGAHLAAPLVAGRRDGDRQAMLPIVCSARLVRSTGSDWRGTRAARG
jgi:translation initiation factor IF-2